MARGTCEYCGRDDQFLKGKVCFDHVHCMDYRNIRRARELAEVIEGAGAYIEQAAGFDHMEVAGLLRTLASDLQLRLEDG